MSRLDEIRWTSSWSSSASMSFKACSASFSERAIVLCGTLAISADEGVIPFFASAAFTDSSCASGVVISKLSGSSVVTSSAPASSTSSIKVSSSTAARGTAICPFAWNIHCTEPASAIRPPAFVRIWRISPVVRFRLSVSDSIRIAMPPGPYPSYVTSS
jgi:hypothetical protein